MSYIPLVLLCVCCLIGVRSNRGSVLGMCICVSLGGGAQHVGSLVSARASLPCDVLLSDWHSLRKPVVSYIDIAVG